MFKRKIYKLLKQRKEETKGTKSLLIEGARRIGKTTIVEEFAKNEYDTYIFIDFSRTPNTIKNYFRDYINDLDTLFMLLQAQYKVRLIDRKSLIVFDEIQFCPNARQAIKHLVKDGRFDYIETGSLISIHENVKDILIPSEERHLNMYPLDFEEFLWAINEKQLAELIKTFFIKKESLPRQLHDKAMLLFKQYILIGGMPKSIAAYLENNKSFISSDKEKRDILSLYRNDIMKIKSSKRGKVLSIFDQIPGFLSKHEKRITFNKLNKNSNYEKYEESFFWLQDAKIINECFLCNDPNTGLTLNEDRTFIKCYMHDTGLLISHTFSEKEVENNIYDDLLLSNTNINNGMFYENAIAQILASNNNKLYFYNHYSKEKKRNDIEIDFLLSNKSKSNNYIYPIEVKSSKNYTTKSLNKFIDKFKNRIDTSYIIHTKNLTIKENNIICIPSYMTFCLLDNSKSFI